MLSSENLLFFLQQTSASHIHRETTLDIGWNEWMVWKDDTDHLEEFIVWLGWKKWIYECLGRMIPTTWMIFYGLVWMKERNLRMFGKDDSDHLDEWAKYGWKKVMNVWWGSMIMTTWMSVHIMVERKEGMNGWEGWYLQFGWVCKVWMKERKGWMVRKNDTDHE